ncbi:MAG TPA: LysR family transcriptional regulator [Candidatus Sulfotelmatobacter sp.]|nr:LysR family transcriptional regulator [Candidatus Sulfotelmatobacter sp.]
MKNEIEIRHLRYFLAVAETLHFGKAADKLRMAQPPLSQQIKNLERMLGYSLFDRTTRGVKLTIAGHFFAERARDTLLKLQDDVEMTRRLASGQEGILNIGFSGSVMLTALPKAIKAYRRLRPNVELRLRELVTAEQIPVLLDGTLAVGFLRDGEPRDGLRLETLLREPYIAVLPANHALARKKWVAPADLKDEPFVLFARRMGALAYDRTMACCEDSGFRPTLVQEAPQWPTVLRLVAAGLGISLAPTCVGHLTMPGVAYRKLRSRRWSSVDIGMKSDSSNPAAEAFLEIVRPVLKTSNRFGNS